MSSIEERVVQLKIDNDQFEQGAKKTLGTLDSLTKGLKLEGAVKGLSDVTNAAKNFTLSHIAAGVDSIAGKFQSLSIIGITALQNITNQAIYAGQSLVKSLTVAPLSSGFHEYETNLNSIQTILSNTQWQNTGLNDVNKALDTLNTYSDQTIYNFSEMARNIGTFTAAGVKLDVATSAIKGIANLAAVSGSNAQQASTAMYQLSQSLAAGKVSLEDWNSVVNAGMGGKVFQDALMETARVHGVAVDKMVKDAGSFRLTLQEGWLTGEVLTETLNKFTGDLTAAQLKSMGYNEQQIAGIIKMGANATSAAQDVKTFTQLINTLQEAAGSGWGKTWQLIFGDFTEAKSLFTNVNNVLGGFVSASADARNKVLGDWKALGGRQVIIDAITNAFNALISILRPIRDAFREIFPATTGQQLYDLSLTLRAITFSLKISDETAAKLKRTFAGVFAVLGLGVDVIKGVASVLGKLLNKASEKSGGFLEFTARIGDFLVKLRKTIEEGQGLTHFFDVLGDKISKPKELLKEIATYVKSLFGGFQSEDAKKFLSIFDKIGQVAKDAWDAMQPFIHGVGSFFSNLGNFIGTALKELDFNDILGIIATGSLAGIALMIKNFIKKITGGFGKKEEGLFSKIKETFEGLTDTLKSMQNTLRAATLIEIALALAVLTVSVVALSKIDSDSLSRALSAMSAMFAQLAISLYAFEKFLGNKDIGKMVALSAAMIILGAAIAVLVISVVELSKLDWNELAKGLTGLAVILTAVTLAVKFMPDDKKLIATGLGIAILAGAIKLLVVSVTDLSGLSWEDMAKGLTGVAVLLGALTLFTKFSAADKGGILQGAGLLLLALGIKLLADAVGEFGNYKWSEIGTGLVTMALALGLIVTALDGVSPTSLLAAAAVLVVATSLGMVGDALKDLGSMSWSDIAAGLTALLGALTIITAALYVIPPTGILGAAALLVVALSLKDVADVLKQLGDMSWGEIGKSLTALLGSLTIISIGMALMLVALPGAAALIIVSAALVVLAGVLTTLGTMSWDVIGQGLKALALAFTVLGVAGLLLTPVVPTLMLLGAAIALIGIGLAAAGAGVFLFATGLAALSVMGDSASATITQLGEAVLGLIPMLVAKLGEALVLFTQILSDNAPAIVKAVIDILVKILNGIDEISPKIINTLLKLLFLMLDALLQAVPRMTDTGLKILIGFLDGIANNIKKVVDSAVNVIVNFLKGISDNLQKIIQSGVDLILSFIRGLTKSINDNSDELGKAGGDLAVAIIKGMVKGLAGGAGQVTQAAKDVAKKALQAAKDFLGINSPSKEFEKIGMGTNEGFALGIDKYGHLVTKATEGVGSDALETLTKSMSGLSKIISGDIDMTPRITPVLDLTNIKKNADQIGNMLSTKPISLDATYSSAKEANASYRRNLDVDPATGKDIKPVASLTYNQYNSSPKALSEAEIYRQTKNQLSTVKKGAL